MQNSTLQEETKYTITLSIDPLSKLKELTAQEINRLSNERRNMESVHSNLDLLLNRYNLEKSYFGQISLWYGAKPWWVKILLFILVAAIGAGLGLLCNMPITVVLITSAIYIFFSFFFINHYNIHQKQTKRLCEDIIEIEKSLTVTINHFNELSNSLKNNIIHLHEFNAQMLINMQGAQENIHMLTAQITKYKQIIVELEQAKETIVQATMTVRQNLVDGNKQYKQCAEIVCDGASRIDVICNSLFTHNLALQFDSELIKTVIAKYQKALDKVYETAERVENFIEEKKSNHTSPQASVSHDILSSASQNDMHFEKELTSNKAFCSVIDDECENTAGVFNSQVLEEARNSRLKTQQLLKKLEQSQLRCNSKKLNDTSSSRVC